MLLYFLAGGSFLSFNSGFAIYVAITLAIFMFVLYRFALPPLIKGIEERETRITNSLEAAEKAAAKAEEVGAENKKLLQEAEIKAQAIRDEAQNEAEKIRQQRLSEAKAEANALVESAKTTIEQEKKAAIEEVKSEVATLAIEAAKIILNSEIDAKKSEELVGQFIKDLSKN